MTLPPWDNLPTMDDALRWRRVHTMRRSLAWLLVLVGWLISQTVTTALDGSRWAILYGVAAVLIAATVAAAWRWVQGP